MNEIHRVQRYRVVCLEFESSKSYENPFLDCTVTAAFTAPSGRVITREAYWNGGRSYVISFAPTETGIWNYRLSAREDSGLDHISGQVECIPYTGGLDIYKHGFLKISEDQRYFTYADGTPFFWLGDTHWEFAYREKWDASNHPAMDSMFRGMIDKRAAQGYTVYQTNLRSDACMGGDCFYWDEAGLPNVEFYQNELDRRMYYLADKGIVNALGLAWFMSIENQEEKYKQLARYIIARYGALPIVWTLAGETGGYDKAKQPFYIEAWRKVALTIHASDSYHHPMTAHYTNERPFACYYQEEDWMDFTLNQAGHGDYVVRANDYLAFLRKYGNKPFVEGEAFYEYCSTLEENGTRLCTDAMVRRVAYLSMQAGGCGYTYGAQGIWDVVWEKGQDNPMSVFNRFDITWAEAIDAPGGAQMGYMRRFYEEQKFWELYPYHTMNHTIDQTKQEADGNPFGKKMPLITVTKDRERWVFYYPQAARKGGAVQGFLPGVYQMQWFDPRSGQYDADIHEFEVQTDTWDIPVKPDQEDWCLIVRKNTK